MTTKKERKPWKVAITKIAYKYECWVGEYGTLSEAREHIRGLGEEGYIYNTVTKKERVYGRK
jgi:hypothetical protein